MTPWPYVELPYLINFLSGTGGTSWLSMVAQYGGGWTGNLEGREIGGKCAGTQNITTARGTFPVVKL